MVGLAIHCHMLCTASVFTVHYNSHTLDRLLYKRVIEQTTSECVVQL